MVQQMGGHTYLIQGGTMDGEGYPLAHTTRAAPATVSFDNRTVIFIFCLFHLLLPCFMVRWRNAIACW